MCSKNLFLHSGHALSAYCVNGGLVQESEHPLRTLELRVIYVQSESSVSLSWLTWVGLGSVLPDLSVILGVGSAEPRIRFQPKLHSHFIRPNDSALYYQNHDHP